MLCITWLLCTAQAHAQAEKGDRLMRAYAYHNAMTAYEYAVMDDPEDIVSWERLARCYEILRDSRRAEIAYNNCLILGDSSQELMHAWFRSMLENAHYHDAQLAIDEYLMKYPSDTLANYLRWGLANMDEYMTKMGVYDVSLVKGVEKASSNMCPVFYKDGIAFSTNQIKQSWFARRDRWTNEGFYQMMHASVEGDSVYAANWIEPVSNNTYHVGPFSMRGGGEVMYYSANVRKPGKKASGVEYPAVLWVYEVSKLEKGWSDPRALPFNSLEYTCTHPAISADGRQLFFSSNRPGGHGGMDIWMCEWQLNHWSEPVCLPEQINTSSDETFPYSASDGKLFFSSNGRPGLGGYDLFETMQVASSWLTAENMGYPVNSPKDDFGVCFNPEIGEGYFTSNRKEGGYMDQLFQFKRQCTSTPMMVMDAETQQPLEAVHVVLMNDDVQAGTLLTDSLGMMLRCLDGKRVYTFLLQREDYEERVINIAAKQVASARDAGVPLVMTLKKLPPEVIAEQRKQKAKLMGQDSIYDPKIYLNYELDPLKARAVDSMLVKVPQANLFPTTNQGDMVNLNVSGMKGVQIIVRFKQENGTLVEERSYDLVNGSLNAIHVFTKRLAVGAYSVEFDLDGAVIRKKMVVTDRY
jgi:hypothetical protein